MALTRVVCKHFLSARSPNSLTLKSNQIFKWSQSSDMRTRAMSSCFIASKHDCSQSHSSQTQRIQLSLPALHQVKRGMAGHSKWQNIQHQKKANDSKKGSFASKLANQLKIAIKDGGSKDPKFNPRLASLIREGGKNGVPKSTIDRVISSYDKNKAKGEQIFMEIMGPNRIYMIVEAYTEKPSFSRQELAAVLKKFALPKLGTASVMHAFEFKGIVQVSVEEGKEVDEDQATEIAIEVEAEDVEKTISDSGNEVLQFICDRKDLHVVRKNLEDLGHEIVEARFAYIPNSDTMVDLPKDQQDFFEQLVEKLEALETTTHVYDNANYLDS